MPGGAIAVVSATRLVYSTANALFNRSAYDQIFGDNTLSICQAVYVAKLTRQNFSGTADNDRRYAFFGDPYLNLGVPRHMVAFTTKPDSVIALATTTIAGVVQDSLGATVSLDGRATIVVRDSRAQKAHIVPLAFGNLDTVSYSVNGPILYRGEVPVANGAFSVTFIAPLDVGYGGFDARADVYVAGAFADASGALDSLRIGATIPATQDTAGPVLTVRTPDRANFQSGDRVGVDELFEFTIEDSSGVNLTGGLGHSLTLTINNDVSAQVNLTGAFAYESGSYRRGSASYRLPNLAPGERLFTLTAWDNANNSARMTFTATITADERLAILDALNYPNPLRDGTGFYFTLGAAVSKMALRVFTMSGRLIFEATDSHLDAGYHADRLRWNGFDHDGDRVATGVYLYTLTAWPESVGEPVSQSGKVVVIN